MFLSFVFSSLIVSIAVAIPSDVLPKSIYVPEGVEPPVSLEIPNHNSTLVTTSDVDGTSTKKKRYIFDGVFDEIFSLLFWDDSDESESDETYLICRNCTVLINQGSNTSSSTPSPQKPNPPTVVHPPPSSPDAKPPTQSTVSEPSPPTESTASSLTTQKTAELSNPTTLPLTNLQATTPTTG